MHANEKYSCHKSSDLYMLVPIYMLNLHTVFDDVDQARKTESYYSMHLIKYYVILFYSKAFNRVSCY